jgi:hypothetical protein
MQIYVYIPYTRLPLPLSRSTQSTCWSSRALVSPIHLGVSWRNLSPFSLPTAPNFLGKLETWIPWIRRHSEVPQHLTHNILSSIFREYLCSHLKVLSKLLLQPHLILMRHVSYDLSNVRAHKYHHFGFAPFLFCLLFNPENGGNIFLRKVGLPPNYTASQPRRP